MNIEYLGHSSFKISSSAGYSAVCDPYEGSIGFSMPKISADAVTVSHRHYDHDFVEAVGSDPVVIEGGEHKVGDISITSTESYHDEARGAKRGKNTIFKFTADGITVCHLGDLGEPPSEARVKSVAPVDVLLIPVGGTYTIDAKEAADYVRAIAPKIVIPMHYRTKDSLLDISGVDGFLNFFDKNTICFAGKSRIEIGRMPEEMKIMVLEKPQCKKI